MDVGSTNSIICTAMDDHEEMRSLRVTMDGLATLHCWVIHTDHEANLSHQEKQKKKKKTEKENSEKKKYNSIRQKYLKMNKQIFYLFMLRHAGVKGWANATFPILLYSWLL